MIVEVAVTKMKEVEYPELGYHHDRHYVIREHLSNLSCASNIVIPIHHGRIKGGQENSTSLDPHWGEKLGMPFL